MPPIKYKKAFNTIIVDFPKVVKPDNTKEKILIPFFYQHLAQFMRDQWTDSSDLMDIVRQLRIESATTKKTSPDCPEVATKESPTELIIKTANDYVNWLHKHDKETRGVTRLRSLVWGAAYKRGLIPSDIYPDVYQAFEYWTTLNTKIFTFSNLPMHEQKIFLNTDKQRKLAPYVKLYVTRELAGEKDDVASYIKIAMFSRTPERDHNLFITDCEAFAKAAREAGLHALVIDRNQKNRPNSGDILYIHTLSDITFGSA